MGVGGVRIAVAVWGNMAQVRFIPELSYLISVCLKLFQCTLHKCTRADSRVRGEFQLLCNAVSCFSKWTDGVCGFASFLSAH